MTAALANHTESVPEVQPPSPEEHLEYMREYLGRVGASKADLADAGKVKEAFEKHTGTPLPRELGTISVSDTVE